MNVNGIQAASYAQEAYTGTSTKKTNSSTNSKTETTDNESGAVYEKSSSKMTDSERTQLIAKLKADTDSHVSQLKSLVQSLFLKQGQKVTDSDDMWSMLASGDLQVDASTAAKAKQEISENGYWGVSQTSDRIFEMAKALSGGDDSKMEKMLDAFKKGYNQATKAWGKTLPGICSQTYDAVLEKFENYKQEN
jgi:hypothetical protein